MKEMGEYSDEEHLGIAEQARSCGFDQLVFVGNEFQQAAERVGALFFENTGQLKTWFDEAKIQDAHILLKGSRSIGLEGMLEGTA
jgi:UDP-N-acetylmuramoyl-tripeptide--D-alanyl-D-alanine ligase